MKKLIALLLITALLLSLAACSEDTPADEPDPEITTTPEETTTTPATTITTPRATTTATTTPPATTTTPPTTTTITPEPIDPDEPLEFFIEKHRMYLDSLEILGYHVADNGDVIVHRSQWTEIDASAYKEYFFGEWMGELWNPYTHDPMVVNTIPDNVKMYKSDAGAIIAVTAEPYFGVSQHDVYWIDPENPNEWNMGYFDDTDGGNITSINIYGAYDAYYILGFHRVG